MAASIGAGLAKAALGRRAQVDGKLVDTSHRIDADAPLAIVTDKDADGLEVIRHSTAHLLAYAVKELFPDAQVTIGPVIENGFYYDFAYKRPFTPEDLAAIEAGMAELARKDEPVVRRVLPRDEAVAYFKGLGEHYKAEIIASIPAGEDVSLYREGGFEDLCRGPHVPSTGRLKHFKLMKVAGAYWRGDQAQRAAAAHLRHGLGDARTSCSSTCTMLEEAEKRDHRKLGRELDLFHLDEHAPGMVFWHPKGWTVWQQVEQYMRAVYRDNGYQEVKGPQILDKCLWEKTGHWDKYRENMFTTESEKRDYALKPMNCPGHILIFKQGIKSYRDLPLRYGEFGQCHRNEPTRRRCTASCACAASRRTTATSSAPRTRSSTSAWPSRRCCRRSTPTSASTTSSTRSRRGRTARIGSDADLGQGRARADGERCAARAASSRSSPGEGAFYGPKIEYTLKDAIGRHWQCGTMQVDFNMPERLGAEYVAEDGARQRPVMLHRAIVGSLERFIGILIEQHAGALPAWLAPVQVVVLRSPKRRPTTPAKWRKRCKNKELESQPICATRKSRYKIREHSMQKVPYILVVGDKEKASGAVAVRARGNRGPRCDAARQTSSRRSQTTSPARSRQPPGARFAFVCGPCLPCGSVEGV